MRPSAVLELERLIVTSADGAWFRTTSNVATPPNSVVVRPEMGSP
jgi:hypothetical protein